MYKKLRHTTVFIFPQISKFKYTFKFVLVIYSLSYKLCELTDDTSVSMYLLFVNLTFQYFVTYHVYISLKSFGKCHKNILLEIVQLVAYLLCLNSVINPLNLAKWAPTACIYCQGNKIISCGEMKL